MAEVVNDKEIIELKEKLLLPYVPFIQKMLSQMKGTNYEKKWDQMFQFVATNKKKLSREKIIKMAETLKELSQQIDSHKPVKVETSNETDKTEPTAENSPGSSSSANQPSKSDTDNVVGSSNNSPDDDNKSEKTDLPKPEERLALKYNPKKKVRREDSSDSPQQNKSTADRQDNSKSKIQHSDPRLNRKSDSQNDWNSSRSNDPRSDSRDRRSDFYDTRYQHGRNSENNFGKSDSSWPSRHSTESWRDQMPSNSNRASTYNKPESEMTAKEKIRRDFNTLTKPSKNPGKDELEKSFKIPKIAKDAGHDKKKKEDKSAWRKNSDNEKSNESSAKKKAENDDFEKPGPSGINKDKKKHKIKTNRIIVSDSSEDDVDSLPIASRSKQMKSNENEEKKKKEKGKGKDKDKVKETEPVKKEGSTEEKVINSALQILQSRLKEEKSGDDIKNFLENLKVLLDGKDIGNILEKNETNKSNCSDNDKGNDPDKDKPAETAAKADKQNIPEKPKKTRGRKPKTPTPTPAPTPKPATTPKSASTPTPSTSLMDAGTKTDHNISNVSNVSATSDASGDTSFKKHKKGNRELDRLNQDINDMFIRDSVLTATGRRTCTLTTKYDESKINVVETSPPSKPAPKSKKVALKKKDYSKLIRPCQVELKRIDVSEYIKNYNEETGRKIVRKQFATKSTSGLQGIKRKASNVATYSNKKKKIEDIKFAKSTNNTNPELHASNTYYCKHCNLCEYKQSDDASRMVSHYLVSHPESEVLISRLEWDVADRIKRNPMAIAGKFQKTLNQVMFNCYFCNETYVTSINFWKNHIFAHTGEYPYRCDECGAGLITKSDKHQNNCQKDCTSVNFTQVFNVHLDKNHLYAHMCDTCHYVQLSRERVEKHIFEHHDDANNVRILKFSIFNHQAQEENDDEITLKENEVEEVEIETSGNVDNDDDEWEDCDEENVKEKPKKKKLKRSLIPDNLNEIASAMAKRKKKGPLSSSSVISDSSSLTNSSAVIPIKDSPKKNLSVAPVVLQYQPIWNIQYALSGRGVSYCCSSENCTYTTVSRDFYVTHLQTQHPQPRSWNGYCISCEKSVSAVEGSSVDEFNHMENVHLKMETSNPENSLTIPVTLKVRSLPGDKLSENHEQQNLQRQILSAATLNKIMANKQQPQIILPEGVSSANLIPITITNSPNIMIRKTGDFQQYSSTNNVIKITPKTEVVQENPIVKNAIVPSPASAKYISQNATSTTTSVPKISMVTSLYDSKAAPLSKRRQTMGPVNAVPMVSIPLSNVSPDQVLRPWLPKPEVPVKTLDNLKIMQQEVCLFVLYKCMGTNCSYYTSDTNVFAQHLMVHEKMNVEDRNNYLACAYCPFVAKNIFLIREHVNTNHNDRFQCGYCFYRACSEQNIVIHSDAHHKQKPRKALNTEAPLRNDREEMEYAKSSLRSNVPPMICVYCKKRFFILEAYKTHLENHPENIITKCIRCGGKVTKNELYKHLIKCHHMGLFQCCYCRMGKSSMIEIRYHLADNHPNHHPYVCERACKTLASGVVSDATSIDSTKLYKFSFNDSELSFVKNCTFPKEQMMNCSNCFEIGTNMPRRKSFDATTVAKMSNNQEMTRIVNLDSMQNSPNNRTFTIKNSAGQIVINTPKNIGSVQPKSNVTTVQSNVVKNTQSAPKQISFNGKSYNVKGFFNPTQIKQQLVASNLSASILKPNNTVTQQANNKDQNNVYYIKEGSISVQQGQPKSNPQISIPHDLTISFSQDKVDEIISKMVKESGIHDSILYKCCVPNCNEYLGNSTSLLEHLRTMHKDVIYYECIHCKKQFLCAINYKHHLKLHALKRFFCMFCIHKESIRLRLDDHLLQVHKIPESVCWPTNANHKDYEKDTFVVAPKTITAEQYVKFLQKIVELGHFNEKIVQGYKTHFKSSEIDLLPTAAIFPLPLSCAQCMYSTKVRTNLYRHLKFLCQNVGRPFIIKSAVSLATNKPSTSKTVVNDPVNPVPCLDNNERQFNKASNLACDAYQEAMKFARATIANEQNKDEINVDDLIEYDGGNDNEVEFVEVPNFSDNIKSQEKNMWPKFVPLPKRFSCNAKTCNYQTNEDELFSHHLKTFHYNEKNYKCPHCGTVLCLDRIDYDNIVFHMKLHGDTLYKCSVCNNIHFDDSVLKAHIKNSHTERDLATVITLRNFSLINPDYNKRTIPPVVRPGSWLCEMCHSKSRSRTGIINHMSNQHEIRYQYKCSHCEYVNNYLKLMQRHFSQVHQNTEGLKVLYTYQQSNPNLIEGLQLVSICTQPLWSRNMHKIKNIRGILFDESEAKSNMKIKSGDNGPLKEVSSNSNDFMYTCYHCKKFFVDGIESLMRHWNIRHKNPILTSNSVVYPGKPFRFYIQKIVSCRHCDYASVYHEVKSHLTISHTNLPQIITEKNNKDKCGVCSKDLDQCFDNHDDVFNVKDNLGITKITDTMIDTILESTNTLYKCKKCEEFKSCILLDVENHMITSHGMTPDEGFQYFYETQPIDLKTDAVDTMSYECRYHPSDGLTCDKTLKNFDDLVDHICDHFVHRQFICIFCDSFGGTLEMLCSHYKKEHSDYFTLLLSDSEDFKFRHPRSLPTEFSIYRMHFVNGLVVEFKDAYNTKYSPKYPIMEKIMARNKRYLEEFKKTQPFKGVKLVTWKGDVIEPTFTSEWDEKEEPKEMPFMHIENVTGGIDDTMFLPIQSPTGDDCLIIDESQDENEITDAPTLYVWNGSNDLDSDTNSRNNEDTEENSNGSGSVLMDMLLAPSTSSGHKNST